MTAALPSLKFDYTDMADMPISHRHVAQLVVLGYSAKEAASTVGVGVHSVNAMLGHPPFMEHVRSLQGRIAVATAEQQDLLNDLFSNAGGLALTAMKKLQKRVDNDETPTEEILAAFGAGMKTLGEVADRLPGRAFTKVTRAEMKTLGVHITNPPEDPAMQDMRARMNAINASPLPGTTATPALPVHDVEVSL